MRAPDFFAVFAVARRMLFYMVRRENGKVARVQVADSSMTELRVSARPRDKNPKKTSNHHVQASEK
jgi:hypothetical protein